MNLKASFLHSCMHDMKQRLSCGCLLVQDRPLHVAFSGDRKCQLSCPTPLLAAAPNLWSKGCPED